MLRPLLDKVVLEIKEKEEITKGGIILSSTSNSKSQVGTVIAVGPGDMSHGVRTIMEVREKDTVFIEKGSGINIEHEGNEYVVVSQKDILAVVR